MIKERNYSIDLLKIVSMYMICILHVLGQGGILYNLPDFSLEYNLAWLIEIICYISVNCYAIITGYLMVDTKFKYKKIINLWIGVVFWSLSLTLIMKAIFPNMIGKKMILMSLFPVMFSEYWYFTAYFGLFFFMPFINKLIEAMSDSMFKKLIITMIILFSFLSLFTDPFKLGGGYSFLWLVSCYFIGAYIKRINLFSKVKSSVLVGCSLFFLVFTFLFKLIVSKYPFLTFGFCDEYFLLRYSSFTILFASVCFIIAFLRIKINNRYLKRFIKRMAPATFGVYIIHVHPRVWSLFMKNRFLFVIFSNPLKIILLVFVLAFILYCLCSYLEMFRIYLFKKLKINKLSDIIYNNFKRIAVKFNLI